MTTCEATIARRLRRGRRRLAAATALSLGLLTIAVPAAPAHVGKRSCGWSLEIAGDQVNVLYPDEAARYWVAFVPIPPGGRAEVRGRYPHARYLSLHTYTMTTQAIDALADVEISPERGSTNPFDAGARRDATRRDYTVAVLNERIPAGKRAANTLYTSTTDGTKSTQGLQLAVIAIRIYQPDVGRDATGGVGLPQLAVVTAQGQRTALPTCPDSSLPATGLTSTVAQAGLPVALPAAGLLAHRRPRWRKYTNAAKAVSGFALDNERTEPVFDALAGRFDELMGSGGLGENVHNKYIHTTFSREFGAVLVFRGKLPATPRTRERQRRMAGGQLRYWSFCTNSQTTNAYACVTDDQVPVDRSGFFTIVVSTAADRPRAARESCGVVWLPAGPHAQSVLILRNMLADPGFGASIQRARVGREAQDMGAYYPDGTYHRTASAADRALGCSPAGAAAGRRARR